jgi:hypothetical protein
MQKLPKIPESQETINEKYGNSPKTSSDRYSSNFLSLMSPKNFKFMTVASAVLYSGFSVYSSSNDPTVLPFAAGLAGYALYKYVNDKSSNKTFSLLSGNIQNELSDFEYPADNHLKLYSRKGTKQALSFAYSQMEFRIKKAMKSIASSLPSFFGRFDKPYIQVTEEDASKTLFVFQILSDLDKDNSPFARRLKEENTFNRDTIKDLLSDSHKFANLMTEQTHSPNVFAKEMIKALGTDAEFILKDFRDYNEGKKEVFSLNVDAYHDALKKIQTENVYKEFSIRLVDMIARGSTGELDRNPDALERSIQRFKEFTTHRFRKPEHNKNELLKLHLHSSNIAKNLSQLAQSGNLKTYCKKLANKIGISDDFTDYLDPDKSDKKREKTDQIAVQLLTGKNKKRYELNHSLERMFVDALTKKIESKIKEHTLKDLDPKELDKLNNKQLAAKLEDYKLSDLEYLNPENATEAIMMRIKARLYYQLNKESCDAQFHTARLPESDTFEP